MLNTLLNFYKKTKGFVIVSHFLTDIKQSLLESDADLDILCRTTRIKKEIIRLLRAKKIWKNNLSSGYYFFINDKKINLDLFEINDCFYPKKWETKMLNNVILRQGFPVLEENDFKYSYLYHVFFHKTTVDDLSLQKMRLFFSNKQNVNWFLEELISFMDINHYHFYKTLDMKRVNNISKMEISSRTKTTLYVLISHLLYRFSKSLRK